MKISGRQIIYYSCPTNSRCWVLVKQLRYEKNNKQSGVANNTEDKEANDNQMQTMNANEENEVYSLYSNDAGQIVFWRHLANTF